MRGASDNAGREESEATGVIAESAGTMGVEDAGTALKISGSEDIDKSDEGGERGDGGGDAKKLAITVLVAMTDGKPTLMGSSATRTTPAAECGIIDRAYDTPVRLVGMVGAI